MSTLQWNLNRKITGTVISHEDIELSEASDDGPIYIFASCTFNNLVNSGHGGAITCSASSSDFYIPQLLIDKCSFKSCESSSGFGGAIYSGGLSSFSIAKTIFTFCNSTTKNGGGISVSSGAGLPIISDTTFMSCYARNFHSSTDTGDDAGGVYITSSFLCSGLHYILQSCRFISCGCYDWGGGGHVTVSYSVVGCTDSLFSACTCQRALGIGISIGTADADCLIHFCFFSCSTSSNSLTDICINRDAGSFSYPFLHSFSTTPITNSVCIIYSWGTRTNPSWLPQGNCN